MKLGDGAGRRGARGAASGAASARRPPSARPVDPAAAAPARPRPTRASGSTRSSLARPPRAFGPAAVVCLTGPAATGPDDARRIVVAGLRELAARPSAWAAPRARAVPARGMRELVARQHARRRRRADRERSARPRSGSSSTSGISGTRPTCSTTSRARASLAGVHVNDCREPTRGWADRVLPGDGVADVPAILARARRAPAGTATTTSRSSPTTAPSERCIPTRSGTSTRPSSCAAAASVLDVLERTDGRGMSRGARERRRNDRNRHERVLRSSSSPPRRSSSPRPRRRARTPASPIVIGWAFDSKGAMAPFDGPALAAASSRQADEREGRRRRPAAADQDLRHAGQQARRSRRRAP